MNALEVFGSWSKNGNGLPKAPRKSSYMIMSPFFPRKPSLQIDGTGRLALAVPEDTPHGSLEGGGTCLEIVIRFMNHLES